MSLQPNGPAPYTTVSAFTTVIDWFRGRGSTGTIDADTVVRAGVSESLGRRTIQSLKLLDLIDDQGKPTTQFKDFAQIRGEDEYKSRLQEWLRAEYAEVLQFCDPSTDSYDRIVEAFRGYEPAGQRRGMASLMLGLWKHSGLPVAAAVSTATEARRAARPSGSLKPLKPVRIPPRRAPEHQANDRGGGEITTAGLPPGLVGLLHQIPRDGRPWTAETRDNFLQAFTAVLNFSVPIGDPVQATPDGDMNEEDTD